MDLEHFDWERRNALEPVDGFREGHTQSDIGPSSQVRIQLLAPLTLSTWRFVN